jgi:hypothetical protein
VGFEHHNGEASFSMLGFQRLRRIIQTIARQITFSHSRLPHPCTGENNPNQA